MKGTTTVQFNYNTAKYGGAIYSEVGCVAISEQISNITFEGNTADFGGAVHVSHESAIFYMDNSSITFKNNVANIDGGAIYFYDICDFVSIGNAKINFCNNSAINSGGAIHLKNKSNLKFKSNSLATFNNNTANFGGVVSSQGTTLEDGIYLKSFTWVLNDVILNEYDVYSHSTSSLIFGGVSKVLFTNNKAICGGAIYSNLPMDVNFNENCTVTFDQNNADFGGAICFETNSVTIFRGNSMVKFTNNKAHQNGGAVYCTNNSNTIIQESSTVSLNNNSAKYNGGAMYFSIFSNIKFINESKSKATFINNKGANGGAIYSDSSSSMVCGGKSTITFMKNEATNGGAVHSYNNSEVKFERYCSVTFDNNNAIQGGAIYSESSCTVNFEGNSNIVFVNNIVQENGGALFAILNTYISIKKNSIIIFSGNNAINNGGSLYSESHSTIIFTDNSTITFNNNLAHNGEGGAIYSNINSEMIYKGNSQVNFDNNHAIQGGAVYFSYNTSLIFDESTVVVYSNGTAVSGGALYAYSNCHITFNGNHTSSVTFNNNIAEQYGGAINLLKSLVTLRGSMTVRFYNNEALSGGAVHANDKSDITISENSFAIFYSNNAKIGGAIFITTSNITFNANCSVKFYCNVALQDGGALYLDDQFLVTFNDHASVTFTNNTASDYGGAIYSKILDSIINFNTTIITFYNNHARTTGNSVFINVLASCNSSCLKNNILGIPNRENSELQTHISTSPSKLVLYSPAYCDENYIRGCDSYYVNNIMLGEEILINTCMYDYYNRPSDPAQFVVSGVFNQDFYIPGSQYVLISCNNTIQGIKIVGNNSFPSNYTMNFTLLVNRKSETRKISIALTVGLVSCHPGYWYYTQLASCACYNASDIVFCSKSGSTIKRGYWFGSVTGKPTVTFCPINYCNFTCCETSNGYYHLYPMRENQCRLHRSGTACGNCETSYTLSFDSVECVPVKNCIVGQTILVVGLTILYWTVLIVVVFLMMHFKVNIGYLYAITYYYSVVDLMLSQNWYLSNELYTVINVMSSFAKVTPQFLGQFCLVEGMSGIDQQFIHYIHPTAISLFLILFTLLARRSHRLSSFVSEGIIHVICCLLLLSYTSVAATSLLLMRPLIFLDVNKVYTYVSPDIEYFHGRHLGYAIVAILFIIVIVIGLPFLLALEPFLNSKVNFIRIKPLLDQFQGCYKDKYRCFAAYYMVCRLAIITIIIANSSNDFIARYLLIATCVAISLIHQIFKPYSNNFLNMFDGAILHLMVLVSVLPLVESFNSFNSNMVVGIAFVFVILPSVSLIVMKLVASRSEIEQLMRYCYFKCMHLHLYLRRYTEVPSDENELVPPTENEDDVVSDNNRRVEV